MSKIVNEDVESRREFLKLIGGAQAIANRHCAGSRQVVHNQVRDGFYDNWKPLLLKDAEEFGVSPHPELLLPKKQKAKWFSTDIGVFIRDISRKYDSFDDMARDTGIPLSSLRFMCEASGYVLYKHVHTLEEAAKRKGVELPDWWKKILEGYANWKNDRELRYGARKKVYKKP